MNNGLYMTTFLWILSIYLFIHSLFILCVCFLSYLCAPWRCCSPNPTVLKTVLFLTEIGMGLTGFGVFFLFFGMVLFFDKALLAIGNVSWPMTPLPLRPTVRHLPHLPRVSVVQILFVSGLSFVIGLERTFRFFFQKHKVKATGFFLGGVLVVLIGWPIIGVVLEIYGFFLLFRSAQAERKQSPQSMRFTGLGSFSLSLILSLGNRGFFPVAVGFIRRVPVLGSLLSLPGISKVSVTSSNASLNECPFKWMETVSHRIWIHISLSCIKSSNNTQCLTVKSWKTLFTSCWHKSQSTKTEQKLYTII